MKLNEILKRCSDSNHPITKQGLYFSGKKYGFYFKDKNGNYVFNEDKFQEYLNSANEKIPDGFLTMKQASLKFGKCVSSIWLYVNKYNIEIKNFGVGIGVKYINERQLEEFIRNNRNSGEEKNGK